LLVRRDDFISTGMFRIAQREDLERKRQQAEEIKAMLFRSPQPTIMKEVIVSLQSDVVREENQVELDDLDAATRGLEESLNKMVMA
jgi:hypothetical protein